MDVKTVCLGLLTTGDASGYDLKKCFESSFSHFFAAGFGSIYPALASLADDGLVTCEDFPQEGKPDRKVYSITASGQAELMRALQNPSPGHKVRSEFLVMMCFAHLMSNEQIDAVIDHRLGEIDRFMRLFDELEDCCAEDVRNGAKFVAGFGRAIANACRNYIDENRSMLVDAPTTKIKSATG